MSSSAKTSSRKLHFFIITCCSLLLIAAWMWRSSLQLTRVERDTKKGILRIAIPLEPSSLDPHLVVSLEGQVVLAALFEGLVVSDPSSPEPLPGVAAHWTRDDSGLVYTFYLRDDAMWSDGHPLRAQDFAFAFKRALRGIPCQHSDQFDVLAGAKAYRLGQADDFESVGIKVLGDHVLRLELQDPTPYFLQLITHWAWSPLPEHVLKPLGAQENINTPWTRPEHAVSNGPFVLKKHVRNGYLVFERNAFYWDQPSMHIEGIHCSFKNPQNQKNAFDSGELHVATAVPSSCMHEYAAHGEEDSVFQSNPYLGTYYYIFNTEHSALKDVRVRRALSLAVNRETIVKKITGAGETPAYALIPEGMPGYTASASIQEDLLQARELMREAGYPEGKGFPKVELLFNTSGGHKLMAEAIQDMWKQALGIHVDLVNKELKTYLDSRKSGDFAIARASWVGDYIDPYTFLSVWHTHSSSNYARWSHPEFDALLDQSVRANSLSDRYAYLAQAEALVIDNAPFMPIYHLKNATLVHPYVKGLRLDLLRRYNFKGVRIQGYRG